MTKRPRTTDVAVLTLTPEWEIWAVWPPLSQKNARWVADMPLDSNQDEILALVVEMQESGTWPEDGGLLSIRRDTGGLWLWGAGGEERWTSLSELIPEWLGAPSWEIYNGIHEAWLSLPRPVKDPEKISPVRVGAGARSASVLQ